MARIALLAALTVVPPAWLQTTDALPQPPGAARASQLLRGAAAARQLQSAGVAGAHAAAQTSRQLLLRGAAATRQLQSAGVADLLSRDRATIYAGEGQHDLSPSPSAAAQLHSGSLYQQKTSATFDGAPTESDPYGRGEFEQRHRPGTTHTLPGGTSRSEASTSAPPDSTRPAVRPRIRRSA